MSFFARLKEKLLAWLQTPPVLRFGFALLRRFHPILFFGQRVIVTRYADVLEVLSRDVEFGVTETYAARMLRTTGPFILGMERGEQYDREATALRKAIRPEDVERIRQMTAVRAKELLDRAKASRRLDAVQDYLWLLPLHMVGSFFGVPGPDDATLKRWMRTIFWDIFLNLSDEPDVVKKAEVSSGELRAYMDKLIVQRQAQGASQPDDFIGRLVQAQGANGWSNDTVRRNVGGVIVGAVDTIAKAAAHSLEQLLERPEALAGAKAAAQANNFPLLSAHVFEALRFNPHNPILLRTCHQEFVLARGTPREKTIPVGKTVIPATFSAMFDEEAFPNSGDFRTDRPSDKYVHFGFGLHRCFGERLARVVVPEAIGHILQLPGLRSAGKMEYEGPFPNRWPVEFD
jgi:cytochrome P450